MPYLLKELVLILFCSILDGLQIWKETSNETIEGACLILVQDESPFREALKDFAEQQLCK
jgi:hypothetical protein